MLKRFVNKLKKLVEIEREEEVKENLEEIKRLSGLQRERRGRAVVNLNGKVVGEEFGYIIVRYGRGYDIKTEISVGDVVIVSRGNPLKSNVKGYVVEKGKRFISVALENVPSWALKNVRVDLIANEVTFKRQLEVLERLNDRCKRALKLYLGMENPGDLHEEKIDSFFQRLNSTQKRAVRLAVGSESFFLIHGPFGTGKTTVVAEIALQLARQGKKVLVCAESNIAVDNIADRLSRFSERFKVTRVGHFSRVSRKLIHLSLFSRVEEHERFSEIKELRNRIVKLKMERESEIRPSPSKRRGLSDEEILRLARRGCGARGLSAEEIKSLARYIELSREIREGVRRIRAVEEEIAREIVEESDIVLATNSSCAIEYVHESFDVVIIDEASQSTIPSSLIPISKAEKFILAGDHKQLPPTVKSLKAKELEKTLFEGLIERYPDRSVMLDVQYRMNEVLMEFPNKVFYSGRIKTAKKVKGINILEIVKKDVESPILTHHPVVFIDTCNCSNKYEMRKRGSTSIYNPLEAEIVRKCVEVLTSSGIREEDIGVISPYDDQVEYIKELLKRFEDVEVASVDAFQGREKEVIVISMVRSNRRYSLGFLKDLRRLNVAITRARRKLIVIGDSKTLRHHKVYGKFIEFVKKKGKYILYSP
jgi:predicted DNA helicase